MGTFIDGKYYANGVPRSAKRRTPAVARQNLVYQKTREYQKFDRELVQPYLPNGEPNPEFIKFYPAEAKEYGFIKEDKNDKKI